MKIVEFAPLVFSNDLFAIRALMTTFISQSIFISKLRISVWYDGLCSWIQSKR
jgi:hypothetical protein